LTNYQRLIFYIKYY